ISAVWSALVYGEQIIACASSNTTLVSF
ncbi:hypothetical protein D047_0854B, partial [Vibrio parahaemolyticus VPTS-2010_2]